MSRPIRMKNLKIDCQKIVAHLAKFIRKTVKEQGFEKVIVALSGGVDSSTALTLAVRALGKDNVLVAILPDGNLNKKETEDALMMVKQLEMPSKNVLQIDIKLIVDSFWGVLSSCHPELDSGSRIAKIPKRVRNDVTSIAFKNVNRIRKGNIIARVRMILVYDLAKKHQALVCGTENKSEYLLGYYTRFGDEASDLEPLRGLYKTQVKQLAYYLGIPEQIIEQSASAGLWPGQTDEKELGFTYAQADLILAYHFDKKYSWERIIELGFNKAVVRKVKKQVEQNAFKKRVPYLAKV